MNHTVPDCMKPDGREPCRGYADLRKEWLSTIDAAHQAGEIHNNVRADLERRIEELERLATQRGARMQIMRVWMEETSMNDPDISDDWVSEAFLAAYPEADDWFDADGVPVREGK